MNKAELIDHIAAQAELPKASAARALDAMIGAVQMTLKKGDSVSLVGFGTFDVTKRAGRTGRNPRTGEAITIESATVPKFRPGKALKDALTKRLNWVLSSVGRAAPLQGVGRRFEPVSTHHTHWRTTVRLLCFRGTYV